MVECVVVTKVPLVPEYETVKLANPVSIWAVASAVLGVGAFFFFLVIPLAVVCGIVGLRQTRGGERRGRGAAITGLTFSIAWTLLLAVFSPLLVGEYRAARRFKCAQNMKVIGESLLEYAEANHGRFPVDLRAVLVPPPNAHRWYDDVAGERSSYVYVGGGVRLTDKNLGETVLVYEPEDNHRYGVNVLFADGHVDYVQSIAVSRMLAGLKAGHHPPWPAATQP